MNHPIKNSRRLPQVDQFVEAIRIAENLSAKLEELPSLKEEIAGFEAQIREAESDTKAMKLAGELADKKARLAVLELRNHHRVEAANQAWNQAQKLGFKAADAMLEVSTPLRSRISEVAERLLDSLVDRNLEAAIQGGDSDQAPFVRMNKERRIGQMPPIIRGVWSLRTEFSITMQALPSAFTARILEEIEEQEREIPIAEEELVRLEAAVAALKQIFA